MEKKKKKSQHYVYRNYLRSWCNAKDQIWCSINGEKPFQTNLVNVAQCNYFYRKDEPFNNFEKQFLYKIANKGLTENVKNTHIKLIDTYNNVNNLYKCSKSCFSDDIKEYMEKHIIELEENIQCLIENIGTPYLKKLQNKNIDFLKNQDEKTSFFVFVAHQFTRTKKNRDNISKITEQYKNIIDMDKILNPVCNILAQQIAGILLRDKYNLILLINKTDIKFITGDQPVINTYSNSFTECRKLEYYYPITPQIAILITLNDYYKENINEITDCGKIKHYNKLIKEESQLFTFAKDCFDLFG